MSSSEPTTNYGAVPTLSGSGDLTTTPVKKKSCNDILFALVFVAHIGLIVRAWITYAPRDDATDFMDRGVWKYVGIATATSLTLSSLALVFMTTFSDELVKIALAFPVVGTAGVLGYGISVGKIWMMVVGAIGFLIAILVACLIRKKIDFAAANLRTALTVIRTNFGLIMLAYLLELVAFGWTILWFDAMGAKMSTDTNWWIFCLYLISFFWTHQVINNLQHTIVASIIATWWYNPQDANSCWDDGLNRAFCHSITYSFGSICFGSLLASIAQALKWTHRSLSKAPGKFGKCLFGCIDCILVCILEIIENFNQWAFSYVGIFGESYITSGREVIKIFKTRNWKGIVEDILADVIMFVMKLTISLITALVGWWLVKYGDDDIFIGIGVDADKDTIFGFLFGGAIGWIVSSIMMELVSSAVKTVIVCFAVAPASFHKHHPELCQEMVAGWCKAFPEECSDELESTSDLSAAVVV